MVKTSATSPTKLASTARPGGTPPSETENNTVNSLTRSAFTGAAINMSWQLAIIVLLPILGGYKLDQIHHTSPVWTLIGLVLALAGSILVIRNALASINNFSITKPADVEVEVKHD